MFKKTGGIFDLEYKNERVKELEAKTFEENFGMIKKIANK